MSHLRAPAPFIISTAEESRAIDAQTINKFGINGFTLMESAGAQAAYSMIEWLEPYQHGVFLCGKGNNGGDALVAARYLAQRQIEATIVFVDACDDLSESAQKNYALLQKIQQHDDGVNIHFYASWNNFNTALHPNFIVDGMLGTGLDSNLREPYIDAVEWGKKQTCPIYAMDIPTGLHADSGSVMGQALSADKTLAFGTLKQGYYLNEGPGYCGHIHYCGLPFPDYLKKQSSKYLIDESWIQPQKRNPARHKYEAGVLHIIAGYEGLTGAGIMAARSAWGEGIGAVVLVCPRGLLSTYENNLPYIIKKPIGSRDDYFFKPDHLQAIQQAVTQKDGPVLVGSGIGREDETVTFVHKFLSSYEGPCIIDADGLWCLAQTDFTKAQNADWILTPHPGELSQLLNDEVEDDKKRLNQVKKYAKAHHITLLSKGYPVMMGTAEGETYITGYDTRVFSRAGFGDVLAGKVGAYYALGNDPEESCIRALIDGKRKITELKAQQSNYVPGPADLI